MVCNLKVEAWVRLKQEEVSRNPLTGLSGLQLYIAERDGYGLVSSQSPYGAKWFATLPPENSVLDGALRGGVCEKDEVWNMHGANNGGFWEFLPSRTYSKRGDEKEKTHTAHPQGKNWLSRSPPGGPGQGKYSTHSNLGAGQSL